MCGIVGVISVKDISSLKDTVKQMNDLQIHRGPDGNGLWSSQNGNVIFGHRRLSIIDLSEAARQPMESQDGRYVIVFNGEIYNYKELREVCIKRGSSFQSNSDTEVIMEYINYFGVDGIKNFRGMWAFVLYDQVKNELLMCRDPFGIKPLHYGMKDGVLYFASEIKSLYKVDSFFKEIDQITKELFINFGYLDIEGWTFFKNVQRFQQACYTKIDLNKKEIKIEFKCYWIPPKKQINISTKDAIDKLDQLLEQSVERHMVSDVPIAFCLSGGLDSSTIVGMASKKAQKGQSLNTFTTSYPDYSDIDETKWAKRVVKHCQTTSHWIEPTYEEFKNEFENVLYYHDEPFSSTSIYAQNTIFNSINKSSIKVSLDGQGADEIFAGYHYYFNYYLITLIKQKKIITFFNEIGFLLFRHPTLLFRNLLIFINKKMGTKNKNLCIKNSEEYQKRLTDIKKSLNKKSFGEFLKNALMVRGLPALLRNGDRNAMKNHVESRVPFLDIDLVNFVISLPDCFKIRRAITKYILRKVSIRYLPKKLVNRKDKLGFPSPEKLWLKKAFNIDVTRVSSKKWRMLIVKKWEEMLLSIFILFFV